MSYDPFNNFIPVGNPPSTSKPVSPTVLPPAGSLEGSPEHLLAILVALASDVSVKPADRISAINSALNRKLGTPAQHHVVNAPNISILKYMAEPMGKTIDERGNLINIQ